MALPTLFEVCEPRDDILNPRRADAAFAADLAQALAGQAPPSYQDPTIFFANTFPTQGLKTLLASVMGRLSGAGDGMGAIFHLDTNYGGGKTHALIALAHAARQMRSVPNADEFVDLALLPAEPVRIAAFDGINADPVSGRELEPGVSAHTPWGELAWALAGKAGFESIAESDRLGIAPGAENLAKLLKGGPALILIDELAVYLRKAKEKAAKAASQLAAFLSALIKAVETNKQAALIYTLALGKAEDAFSKENEDLEEMLREPLSVSARKATLLNPTGEDETASVLRRRLFKRVDEAGARSIVDAYVRLWNDNHGRLPSDCQEEKVRAAFHAGYPFHPELLATLTNKTATLANFQRVRGMLRILGHAIKRLWQQKPRHAHAIQLHDIDLSADAIRQELVTRLQQSHLVPALKADVAAVAGDAPALAAQIDRESYAGYPPYASAVAGVIFLHTLAYNQSLRGTTPDHLRYAILSPAFDQLSFIDDATRRFQENSAYLDDRAGAPLRFSHQPNLNQITRQYEERIEPAAVMQLGRRETEKIFRGALFQFVPFPGSPADLPDASERPLLALLSHEAVTVGDEDAAPELALRLWRETAGERPRTNRNNIIFVVADKARHVQMEKAARRLLALDALAASHLMRDLQPDQRNEIAERRERAAADLALAIQQTFRHIYRPGRSADGAACLAHIVCDQPAASAKPGSGESQIITALSNKLRKPGELPCVTEFLISATSLARGPASIEALWRDFRENPGLPLLQSPSVLHLGLQKGIESGSLIYKKGDLIWARGEPPAPMGVGADEMIYTEAQALASRIWPRQPVWKPDTTFFAAKLASGSCSLEVIKEAAAANGQELAPEDLAAPIAAGNLVYYLPDEDLVWANGLAQPAQLSDNAVLYTAAQARAKGIWPRQQPGGQLTISAGEEDIPLSEVFAHLRQKIAQEGLGRILSARLTAREPRAGFMLARLAAVIRDCHASVDCDAQWGTADNSSFSVNIENATCPTAAGASQWLAPLLREAGTDSTFNMSISLSFDVPLPGLAPLEQAFERANALNVELALVGER